MTSLQSTIAPDTATTKVVEADPARQALNARLVQQLVDSGIIANAADGEDSIRARYTGAFHSMTDDEALRAAALIDPHHLADLQAADDDIYQLATAFGEQLTGSRWGRLVCCMLEASPYVIKFGEEKFGLATLRGAAFRSARSVLSDHSVEAEPDWMSYSLGHILHVVVGFRRTDIKEEPPTMEHMKWVTTNIKALAPFSHVFMARGTMNRGLCDELLRDIPAVMADGVL